MGVGLDHAIALTLLSGDAERSIDGLATFAGFTIHTASPSAKEIWVAEEPSEPDSTVTVILEGGSGPIAGSHGINPGRRPAFTVRSRDPEYGDAQSVAFQIYRILDGFEGLVNGIPIMRIIASTEPIPLGRDREGRGGRWVFSHTFNAITKRYDPS